MSSVDISLPPLVHYPERQAAPEGALQRLAAATEAALFARMTYWRAQRLGVIVNLVSRASESLRDMKDAELRQVARAAGVDLRQRRDWPEPLVARCFAIIREAATRLLGQRHHDVQLIGGYALLRGMMAEMGTGEGKTLAASLAAGAAALAGVPVHVITVNCYLAKRDAETLAPLYDFLGVSLGAVVEDMTPEQRAAAYRCDIVYCTNKDVAFDYMRDRLRLGRRLGNLRRKAARLSSGPSSFEGSLLRGLHFAIIDEADSVLIDEARTPLILSRGADGSRNDAHYDQALELARDLSIGADYALIPNERRVQLMGRGRRRLEKAEQLGSPWDEIEQRERLVTLALTTLYLMRRDEHYLVRDGKIEIIDEYTGRILPDRVWSDDLQELIERKEGLALSERRATEARMTYQRFFRRYRRLAGMTGTAREVVGELWRVYRLPVASIPPNRPSQRIEHPPVGHRNSEAKWCRVIADVAAVHKIGVPVLIGTRTVAHSALVSSKLTDAGLDHVVLSAAQDAAEAEIISCAGRRGVITVATNMAGRGTDIRPDADALAQGGLLVVVTELHEAARIDRQLAGRAGRQGEPGEVRTYVSLDDAVIERHGLGWLTSVLKVLVGPLGGRGVALVARLAQRRAERLHGRMRRELLKSDEWLGDATAFAGEQE